MKSELKIYLINCIILTLLAFIVPQPSMLNHWTTALTILLFCYIIFQIYLINRKLIKIKYSVVLALVEYFVLVTIIQYSHIIYVIKQIWPTCNTDIFRFLCVLIMTIPVSIILYLSKSLTPKRKEY